VENDGWLSGHEPQLRMMIEAYKRYDGQAFVDLIHALPTRGRKVPRFMFPGEVLHQGN
jgi:hypothetical protein